MAIGFLKERFHSMTEPYAKFLNLDIRYVLFLSKSSISLFCVDELWVKGKLTSDKNFIINNMVE